VVCPVFIRRDKGRDGAGKTLFCQFAAAGPAAAGTCYPQSLGSGKSFALVPGRHVQRGRVRSDHAPQNLNIVRKIAMNMLRMKPVKETLPKKRLRACMNPEFLAEILGVAA